MEISVKIEDGFLGWIVLVTFLIDLFGIKK